MKATGITDDDKKAVYAKIYQDDPAQYNKIQQYNKDVAEYDEQQQALERQRRIETMTERFFNNKIRGADRER